MISLLIASLACTAWIYLLLLRGGFWRTGERDAPAGGESMMLPSWPHVTAIVPARDEARVIAATLHSLLQQNYPGRFDIVVVDDHSNDGTGAVARAASAGAADRLVVLAAPDLADGWTGKLWALNAGTAYVDSLPEPPAYLLFTDADISYVPEALTELVTRAERGGLVLTSLMAKLRCASLAERAMIPAFIFFFRMLYPFAWVNRRDMPTAAAAGGCMLVQRKALRAAGGLARVRGQLIDDCALGRLLKAQGPIWLGLTNRAQSLRAYGSIADIRQMVGRSAYAQLGYSPLLLAGTVAAMAVVFLAPPVQAVGSTGMTQWLAASTWLLMALALQPTLRFYGVSPWWGVALPVVATMYLGFTLDSAWQHWRGRGGMWKGRTHVPDMAQSTSGEGRD
jgi:hopene-associated glycosyltransferase HpnB